MSEAQILAAFWMPGQRRFCELVAHEVKARSGFHVMASEFQSACDERLIVSGQDRTTHAMVYRLTKEGRRRVSQMVDERCLPKSQKRVTATPQGQDKTHRPIVWQGAK